MAALHNHLLLNGYIANPPTDRDEDKVGKWLESLVKKIGMKKVAGPVSCYVKADGNAGMTAAVLIETSHIAMHIWDEVSPAKIQFDLYTCSTLPLRTVIDEINNAYGLVSCEYQVIERESGFRVVIAESF